MTLISVCLHALATAAACLSKVAVDDDAERLISGLMDRERCLQRRLSQLGGSAERRRVGLVST